ncbi:MULTISPECIES: outer membrane beta-barrel protein [unclassified Flavobacterium]|uniref:outer membrane beta-barrel protein n=1 Tax=unclassified Flavobacterium TaxID=196869 RepID=UPI000F0D05BB|nr:MULTISPECIES: outer membrane beta-barrel protein [unclassified Flavobacterium]AYN05275.1 porin family protein [Flavobacterium sp. 140616W15]MCD0473588.1 outer membrane beta-barrel protein [Flavobacterium sp. EDS]
MKKLLLCVALVVSAMATAQKGTILVGGNVEYSSDKIGDVKNESFDFSPTFGYQFSENWTAGVNATVGSIHKEGSKSDNQKIGGFVRYSRPLSETFAIFADIGSGYQQNSINDAKGMYAYITPALFINMKQGFGLNFSIGGFNYDNIDGKNDPRREKIGFNFGKTLNIGISKNFTL